MGQSFDHFFGLVRDEVVMLQGVGHKLSGELIDSTVDKYAKKLAYLLKNFDEAQEKAKLYEFFQIHNV